MVTLLWLLLVLIGLPLVAVVLVLAFPLHLSVFAKSGADARVLVHLRLLGGLVPRIAIVDTTRTARSEKSKTRASEKRKSRKKDKPRRKRKALSRETILRMVREAPGLLSGEIRRFHINRFRLEADYGLDDPAATGELYGWMCPLLFATPLRRHNVALRPDFTGRRFEAEVDTAVSFTPLSLVVPALRFGWRVFVVKP